MGMCFEDKDAAASADSGVGAAPGLFPRKEDFAPWREARATLDRLHREIETASADVLAAEAALAALQARAGQPAADEEPDAADRLAAARAAVDRAKTRKRALQEEEMIAIGRRNEAAAAFQPIIDTAAWRAIRTLRVELAERLRDAAAINSDIDRLAKLAIEAGASSEFDRRAIYPGLGSAAIERFITDPFWQTRPAQPGSP